MQYKQIEGYQEPHSLARSLSVDRFVLLNPKHSIPQGLTFVSQKKPKFEFTFMFEFNNRDCFYPIKL